MHDLIIRNAEIIDGTGAPAQHGDIAIDDNRITSIGKALGSSREEVHANGMTLAPVSYTHLTLPTTPYV